MEATISRKWIKRSNGEASKVYRRLIDKKRDEVLPCLKSLIFYNSIGLENFLLYSSKLLRFDKAIQLNEKFDIYSFLDCALPIDLYYIQNNSVYYIKNYICLNRS